LSAGVPTFDFLVNSLCTILARPLFSVDLILRLERLPASAE
jgi:hypothetical protein